MDIVAVARHAGVSTATVSRVLNCSNKVREETAEHVRKVIQELNYIPSNTARTLRSGRSHLYGLLVSDIRNPFFPDLIEHFESLATQHGIDVTVANTGYSEDRLLKGVRRLLEREVDGIAVLTSEVSARVLAIFRSSDVSVVFLNQPVRSPISATSLWTTFAAFARAWRTCACWAMCRSASLPVLQRLALRCAVAKHSLRLCAPAK